jgi:ABC-type multidrug transport system permease subunit
LNDRYILVLFARKNPIKLLDAWIAVILDAAWVIGSYPLLFVVPFSTSGKWVVGMVAEVVMVVALMLPSGACNPAGAIPNMLLPPGGTTTELGTILHCIGSLTARASIKEESLA